MSLALPGPLAKALALLALSLPLPLLLSLLTLLSLLPLLAGVAAGAVRIVHQPLLLADQIAELIEHLHHLLAAAVLLLLVATGHAA